ncbi:protein kinase 2B, chloroplastic-like [Gossypium australe]|uniref:Protein kinase 2B, chloroplastic-like n=1 Tax=Gossypium australe TaxID=47621 RepID=A0A5B6VYJ6_9ROSI|nr:protein kinase 2B, chloroplastic-like [Gossypium australe]
MDKDIEVPIILGRPFLATARPFNNVGNGELLLKVGDEDVTLQACDFMRVPSERDDTSFSVNVSYHGAQCSLQEITHENVLEPYLVQSDRTRGTSEEQMVQFDELDKWKTKSDENPRMVKEITKQRHIGNKVLLDKSDLQMFPAELKLRGSNPFVVQNVFPHGTIEVTHPEYDTFKVNNH